MAVAATPHRLRPQAVAGLTRLARHLQGRRVALPSALLAPAARALAAAADEQARAGLRTPHPWARALLACAVQAPPLSDLPVPRARAVYARMAGALPAAGRGPVPQRFTLTAGAHRVAVRVYGHGRADLPLLCWFPGGAFVLGDLDTEDPECRALATAADTAVVAIGYPRAPEARFPAAVDVAVDVVRQIAVAPERLGISSSGGVVLAGASSGANLAINCALALRDDPVCTAVGLALVHPMVDLTLTSASLKEFGDLAPFTRGDLERFVAHYLPSPSAARDPRASPLHAADLADLPPSLVVAAGVDPLVDDADHLARRLTEAGVETHLRTYERLVPGFLQWRGLLPERAEVLGHIAALTRPAGARRLPRALPAARA